MKRFPNRPQHPAGFTLIELLTASIAAALILLAIYGLFQRAVKMRDHATERSREAQLRGRAERVIRNDLRNAFVSGTDSRLLATVLEGGKQNLQSRFPGSLRFTATTGKDTKTEAYGDVQEIEYAIAENDESGDHNTGTLTRFITRDLLSTTQTTPIEEPLLRRVSSMEVGFFDGQSWQESWQFSENNPTLPQAFRIRIQQTPASDQTPAPPVLEIMEPITVVAQTFDSTSTSGTTASASQPTPTPSPTPAPTPQPTPTPAPTVKPSASPDRTVHPR